MKDLRSVTKIGLWLSAIYNETDNLLMVHQEKAPTGATKNMTKGKIRNAGENGVYSQL